MASGDSGIKNSDIRYFNSKDDDEICKCKKDHKSCHEQAFVSIFEFSTSDIAAFCKKTKILELVEAIIKLTVRITVNHASLERGEAISNSNRCNRYNNSRYPKLGSGTVLEVSESKVNVLTAKHVVFNSEESKKTECLLYFEENRINEVTIKGTSKSKSDIAKDYCIFTCEFDEKEKEKEIEKLQQSLKEYEQGRKNINRSKMKRHKKCIIVSHPHGCYKYVSMGSCELNEDGYLTYNTPTCKGSSGGYIVQIGSRTGVYIHSGIKEVDGVIIGQSSGEIEQHRLRY